MKLRLMKSEQAVDKTTTEFTTNAMTLGDIAFTKKDNSTFEAAVPIRLPSQNTANDTVPRSALQKITVTCSSEKAKGGTVRVLCKVNMPYIALDPLAAAGTVTNSQFDPSRSGKDITAHAVITLPKAAVEDLRGQRVGSDGIQCAQAQVGLIYGLLQSLLGASNGVLGKAAAPWGALKWDEDSSMYTNIPLALTVADYSGDGEAIAQKAKGPMFVTDVEGYAGVPGIDTRFCGVDMSDPDSFITRALLGLPPSNDGGSYGYVATKSLSS